MKKTALVTGGSSGIGLMSAKALIDKGYEVYEFSRHGKDHDGIRHITCDVSDEKQVIEAVDVLIGDASRIDVVINCAGFGIAGACEFTDLTEAKRQFDVNLFGMVNVNKHLISHLKQSQGRIINISSVAACAPIPFQAFYSASKAAVNSYTLALANELRPFGISVCAIMPGDTATGFTANRRKDYAGDKEYRGRISASIGKMEKDEQGGDDAKAAGEFIAMTAERKIVKPLYTIGTGYKLIVVLLKILPCRLSNWLIGKIY